MKYAPTIMTVSGTYVDFLDPAKSIFTIHDIAHALAHICRFTGHCREFYSVAQHSVLVSYVVPRADALAGLLHDAAEAFIGDVASPLKQLLPEYKAIEKGIENEVLKRFGLSMPLAPSVKYADRVLLATERRDLMPSHPAAWEWTQGFEPLDDKIIPWSPTVAREYFLARFNELYHEP